MRRRRYVDELLLRVQRTRYIECSPLGQITQKGRPPPPARLPRQFYLGGPGKGFVTEQETASSNADFRELLFLVRCFVTVDNSFFLTETDIFLDCIPGAATSPGISSYLAFVLIAPRCIYALLSSGCERFPSTRAAQLLSLPVGSFLLFIESRRMEKNE